ncbi:MAG: DedA family protein [Magnetococcales bacterium]|nr:DedA family protein [Magnetococcales bacterium]
MIRRLYQWTMGLAASPNAVIALFLVALAESSFFPIPPDVLLLPMVLAQPKKGFWFATVCTIGSAIGGAFGYLIGQEFMHIIGEPIIQFYGAADRYEHLGELFRQYDVWIIAIAGFSPIPYKLFTISAGAFGSNFAIFFLVSILSRGARFFLVAALLRWGGDRLRLLVEKHLELLTVIILLLVISTFILIKLL